MVTAELSLVIKLTLDIALCMQLLRSLNYISLWDCQLCFRKKLQPLLTHEHLRINA